MKQDIFVNHFIVFSNMKQYIINHGDYIMSTEQERIAEFTKEMVDVAIRKIGVDFNKVEFTEEQFRKGVEVEYKEHMRTVDGEVTMAARIALDHLEECPTYYDYLEQMETQIEADKSGKHEEKLPSIFDSGDDSNATEETDPLAVSRKGRLSRRKRRKKPSIVSFQGWNESQDDGK